MTPVEITNPREFHAAVLEATQAAIAREARTLLWVDPDFEAWPLGEAALLDALTAWLRRPGRRLVLLAARWDRLERAHPRFVQWRPTWSHAVEAREPSDEKAQALPTLLLDDGPIVLELWERDPLRGRAGRDPLAAATARDRIDATLQHASAGWPVKPLGL
ncbi:MAG: hypothetical protein Fur0014_05960 [Rubrivivax sp.]